MIQRRQTQQITKSLKAKKSILLLGPRQVGKSTLVHELHPSIEFNLASESLFLEFARDPGFLESKLKAILPKGGIVFIDEVQRVPSILNTIQFLIDGKKGYQFILTGSSARKLKRGKANLLPGSIHTFELGPLTCLEIGLLLNELGRGRGLLGLGLIYEGIGLKNQEFLGGHGLGHRLGDNGFIVQSIGSR